MTCRYSYLSGACANKHVDSLQCIGQDKCEYSGMNVMVAKKPRSDSVCGHENWLGLYCERYGRFFCPGKEHCATLESYESRLALHLARRAAADQEDG